MSFTNQKPWVVTAGDLKRKWGGRTDNALFRCACCGHRFVEGDVARWLCTNTGEMLCRGLSGNPFICAACDGPREDVLVKLQKLKREAERYWWFMYDSGAS